MKEKCALYKHLYEACTARQIDFKQIDVLLKQTDLLPAAENILFEDIYDAIVSCHCDRRSNDLKLRRITEMLLQHGMVVSGRNTSNTGRRTGPLWQFAFFCGEKLLFALRLLLDAGLDVHDIEEMIDHMLLDWYNCSGELDSTIAFEYFYDNIRKILLAASYPHILQNYAFLRELIWLDENDFDLSRFRNWRDFSFEIDTRFCAQSPEAYRSVVNVIEKASGIRVWRFGFGISPQEYDAN